MISPLRPFAAGSFAGLILVAHAWAGPAAPAAPANEEAVLTAPLVKAVQRLAGQGNLAVADLAELAQKTIAWGQRLGSGQPGPAAPSAQPLPEGPVRDALAAVAAGAALDPQAKAANWNQLRRDLEALLRPPPPQQKPEPPPSQKDQPEQKKEEPPPEQKPTPPKESAKPPEPKSEQPPPDQKPPEPQKKPGESAFGDMQKPEPPKTTPPPPPPPPAEMQQVGGEKKPAPEKTDPALALPQQKLEQLKTQDSPARLFQLLEDKNPRPEETPAKNW